MNRAMRDKDWDALYGWWKVIYPYILALLIGAIAGAIGGYKGYHYGPSPIIIDCNEINIRNLAHTDIQQIAPNI
jgi:hypothetical protein